MDPEPWCNSTSAVERRLSIRRINICQAGTTIIGREGIFLSLSRSMLNHSTSRHANCSSSLLKSILHDSKRRLQSHHENTLVRARKGILDNVSGTALYIFVFEMCLSSEYTYEIIQ